MNPTAFVDDARVVCNAIADASKWDDNDGDDIEIIRRPSDDDDDDDDEDGYDDSYAQALESDDEIEIGGLAAATCMA